MSQHDFAMATLCELAENVSTNRFSDAPNCAYVAEELVDQYSRDYNHLDPKSWNTLFNRLTEYLTSTHL